MSSIIPESKNDGILYSSDWAENSSHEEKTAHYKNTGKWYAPSMFLTNYGYAGWKIEVQAYRYVKDEMETDGFRKESAGYNINAKTMKQAKFLFWQQWNKDHKDEHLDIWKSMSSWGL